MRFGLNGHVCLALSVAFICYSIDNLEASISWNWENPLPQGNRLNGIWGTSRNDVWYVGEDGALGHFDGTAWVRHDVGSIDIWGISGISSKDVWVVGHAYPQPVALHWDGNGWTRTEFGTTGPMFRVWESAPADVWAGGERGLFHWDGSTWSPVLSPLPYNVMGIWGTSPDDVWAWDSDGRG